jgi:hypothetical protein
MAAKFVKLVTGEELVVDIEEKDGSLFLKNPSRLMATKEGMALVPFFPLCKNEGMGKAIKLDAKYIMLVLDLDDEVYNGYNQQFGSGIVLPTAEQTMKIVTE